jgi:hypothetical protein
MKKKVEGVASLDRGPYKNESSFKKKRNCSTQRPALQSQFTSCTCTLLNFLSFFFKSEMNPAETYFQDMILLSRVSSIDVTCALA